MRSDNRLDDSPAAFTLVCPGFRGLQPGGGAAEKRGSLVFTIGSEVVAQIDHDDLLESWAAAADLTAPEAARMAAIAASRLSELLDGGIPAADLTEAVTDAAVVLLLAMRRHGVSDPKWIPACTVMWNGVEAREHVFFGE